MKIGLVVILCCLAVAIQAHNATQVLISDEHLHINLFVNVVLLGFTGDSNHAITIDTASLRGLLQDTFPKHTPSYISTGRLVNIVYNLHWNVEHAASHYLREYEQKLSEELKTAIVDNGVGFAYTDTFVPLLSQLYTEVASKNNKDEQQLYVIFLVNPNRRNLQLPPLVHSYTYAISRDDPVGSSIWVGTDRWVLVDLASHATEYGSVEGQSAVTHHSIPYVDNYVGNHRSPALMGTFEIDISVLCMRAVQYLFAADIQYEVPNTEEQVLIPIFVLKNHNMFDPLQAREVYSINIDTIEREVAKMFGPSQQFEIITAAHGLHDHKRIAVAIYKALRTESSFFLSPEGEYETVRRTYLDSKIFLHELRTTDDIIAATLLGSETGRLQKYFTNLGAADKARNEITENTRILPVYVLSLVGIEKGLTLEHHQLMIASKEAVVVLQTNETKVEVPYFYNRHMITVNAMQPTRHIIAGISKALGGLSEPTERYSHIHKDVQVDYLFAFGYHPYGLFSRSEIFSALYLDGIRRNTIFSRVDYAISTMRNTLEEVETFARNYLYNPLGDPVSYADKSAYYWTDVLASEAENSRILETITQLRNEVNITSTRLHAIANALSMYNLEQALDLSADLVKNTTALRNFVREGLASVELEVMCCFLHLNMEHPKETSGAFIIVLSVLICVSVIGLIALKRYGGSIAALKSITSRRKTQMGLFDDHTL